MRVDMNRVFLPSNSDDYKNEFCLFWTAVCDVNVESDKLSATSKKFDHIVPMIHMEVIEKFQDKACRYQIYNSVHKIYISIAHCKHVFFL